MLCTLIGAIILSINIQVGLNMHLYDDIGDASSSLRGSTSSFSILCIAITYIPNVLLLSNMLAYTQVVVFSYTLYSK